MTFVNFLFDWWKRTSTSESLSIRSNETWPKRTCQGSRKLAANDGADIGEGRVERSTSSNDRKRFAALCCCAPHSPHLVCSRTIVCLFETIITMNKNISFALTLFVNESESVDVLFFSRVQKPWEIQIVDNCSFIGIWFLH